jgi:hypothetical protein
VRPPGDYDPFKGPTRPGGQPGPQGKEADFGEMVSKDPNAATIREIAEAAAKREEAERKAKELEKEGPEK